MTHTAQETLSIIDELTFRNYAHNRMLSPHITPEQWALIYSNVPEMEERYKLASTGNILDVANQGRGIAPSTESITVGIGGAATAIASPLYLLASEIVDVVEFAAQYRAEEEAAAEEGALIEASGYSDPARDRSFA